MRGATGTIGRLGWPTTRDGGGTRGTCVEVQRRSDDPIDGGPTRSTGVEISNVRRSFLANARAISIDVGACRRGLRRRIVGRRSRRRLANARPTPQRNVRPTPQRNIRPTLPIDGGGTRCSGAQIQRSILANARISSTVGRARSRRNGLRVRRRRRRRRLSIADKMRRKTQTQRKQKRKTRDPHRRRPNTLSPRRNPKGVARIPD